MHTVNRFIIIYYCLRNLLFYIKFIIINYSYAIFIFPFHLWMKFTCSLVSASDHHWWKRVGFLIEQKLLAGNARTHCNHANRVYFLKFIATYITHVSSPFALLEISIYKNVHSSNITNAIWHWPAFTDLSVVEDTFEIKTCLITQMSSLIVDVHTRWLETIPRSFKARCVLIKQ